jgi:hypothetical protein
MDINPAQLARAAAVQQRFPRNTKDGRKLREPRRRPSEAQPEEVDLPAEDDPEAHQVDDVA